jgi:hypothetical protein
MYYDSGDEPPSQVNPEGDPYTKNAEMSPQTRKRLLLSIFQHSFTSSESEEEEEAADKIEDWDGSPTQPLK